MTRYVDESYRKNLQHTLELRDDKSAIKKEGVSNLRTTVFKSDAPNRDKVKESTLFSGVRTDHFHINRWLNKIGTSFVLNSMKDLCNKLGLNIDLALAQLLLEANDKNMLLEEGSDGEDGMYAKKGTYYITVQGFNFIAAFINRFPLVDFTSHFCTCLCGNKHKVRKSTSGLTINCKLLSVRVIAFNRQRVIKLFYTELIKYLINYYTVTLR